MAVMIDKERCIGCGKCQRICPGNLITKDEQGVLELVDPGSCWNCFSCVKECPVGAILLRLPVSLSGSGGYMKLSTEGKQTTWTVVRGNGEEVSLVTDTEVANSY